MKKMFAMLLALVMTLSLVACGSKTPGNEPGSPDEEVVTISIANYDQPNSFTVACIEEFIKYAEEHSNGTLKFKTTYGAALCSMPEEYEYMKAGAVDMIAMIPPFCMSELPYIYAVNNTAGEQDVVDYTNFLWFENEETAAIVDKYCTAAGVVLLGSVDAGSTILCGNYESKSYADMTKGKMGCARDYDVYASLGLNPVNVDPTESYDNLQRGVCDSLAYTPSSYYMTNIYEVAPYCLNTNVYGNSNTYMMSLAKWNTLSENQQMVLRDAMATAQAFSVQGNKDSVENAKGVAKAWNELSAEEAATTCGLMEMANNTLLLQAADNLGTTQDMLTILKAKEAYTGIPQIPESYK